MTEGQSEGRDNLVPVNITAAHSSISPEESPWTVEAHGASKESDTTERLKKNILERFSLEEGFADSP